MKLSTEANKLSAHIPEELLWGVGTHRGFLRIINVTFGNMSWVHSYLFCYKYTCTHTFYIHSDMCHMLHNFIKQFGRKITVMCISILFENLNSARERKKTNGTGEIQE